MVKDDQAMQGFEVGLSFSPCSNPKLVKMEIGNFRALHGFLKYMFCQSDLT